MRKLFLSFDLLTLTDNAFAQFAKVPLMRLLTSSVIYMAAIFGSTNIHAQGSDTLMDVGGYSLHFHIIKGKGIPILFEAGGGEDARTWKNILQTIADSTKTTLITYDRAGFGKSSFDTLKHGIRNGVIGLEAALRKLGYDKNIILVAHSQGGLYATLYASRHASQVKAAVLIDITTACFYDPKRLAATQASIDANNERFRKERPGVFYQGADFSNNINYVRNIVFPKNIPVTDIVSEFTPFKDQQDTADWKNCHRQFAGAVTNRTAIMAYGAGHFIFEDNPALVIHAIVEAYKVTLRGK